MKEVLGQLHNSHIGRQNKTKVGLKGNGGGIADLCRGCQNKTKVGLKVIIFEGTLSNLKGQNKTKVGLKGATHRMRR